MDKYGYNASDMAGLMANIKTIPFKTKKDFVDYIDKIGDDESYNKRKIEEELIDYDYMISQAARYLIRSGKSENKDIKDFLISRFPNYFNEENITKKVIDDIYEKELKILWQ